MEDSVAVVITTFNHAHFLIDALNSVGLQSRLPEEVILVDDGSEDDPDAVACLFKGVRVIRQQNSGLAAARNTGLFAARTSKIVFLDADDVLDAAAIERGLAAFLLSPNVAFVYGAHRIIDAGRRVLVASRYIPIGPDPYCDLLRINIVGMHATVMYDREKLVAIGGFNPELRYCEDYDVYLRLARASHVASHEAIVADYRRHACNMSSDHLTMLRWVLRVHAQEKEFAFRRPETARAWVAGRTQWRRFYAGEILNSLSARNKVHLPARLHDLVQVVFRGMIASPPLVARRLAYRLVRLAKGHLNQNIPPSLLQKIKRTIYGTFPPPLGKVDFGHFKSQRPISRNFGFDRGTPIDRYYIEKFLASHRDHIKGRVLEIGDATYCQQFGGDKVTHQDVLHISQDAPGATIVGDLSQAGLLPENAFDSLIITQTLHLIYDMRGAVVEMHKALRPGGILLLTVPGISPVDRHEWGKTWFWALTVLSAQRLFSEIFGVQNVKVEGYGNAFAATAFLQGIAVEEVDTALLDSFDEAYPITVTVNARKSQDA
jgi:glycosyltransferase involved in cell wall biosynthesis